MDFLKDKLIIRKRDRQAETRIYKGEKLVARPTRIVYALQVVNDKHSLLGTELLKFLGSGIAVLQFDGVPEYMAKRSFGGNGLKRGSIDKQRPSAIAQKISE